MTHETSAPLAQATFAQWFKADAAFSALVVAGAPALALQCEPFAVAYANFEALGLFSLQTPQQLTTRLEKSEDGGSRRLRELSRILSVGGPRLERLRLALRGGGELVTVLCRKIELNGKNFLVLAAMGLRPALQREIAAAVEKSAATVPAVPAPPHEAALPQHEEVLPPPVHVHLAATPVAEPVQHSPARDPVILPEQSMRFVFQTDAAGILTQISPEFVKSPLVGAEKSIGSKLAALSLNPSPALSAALAGQQTFRNLELHWPLIAHALTVPVSLSASPVNNAQKAFAGFRGFGIVHFDRKTVLDSAALPKVLIDFPHSPPMRAEIGDAHVPDTKVTTEPSLKTELAPEPVALAPVVPESAMAKSAAPITAAMASAVKNTVPDSSVEVEQPSIHEGTPKILPEAPAHPEDFLGLASLLPPPEVGNVVALHPGKPIGHFSSVAPTEFVPLSTAERQAFREIAKALGARGEDDSALAANGEVAANTTSASKMAAEVVAEQPNDHSVAALATTGAISETAPPEVTAELAAAAAEHHFGPIETPVAIATPVGVAETAPAPLAAPDYGLARNAAHLLDRLPMGVLVSRGDVPIYVNQTLLDLLGYHSADQFHAEAGMEHLFASPSGASALPLSETRPATLNARNGETIMADAHLQTISWDGDAASLLSFRRASDPESASKLKGLELDLRAREAEARELHGILDTATDGIVVMDDRGRLLALNRSGEALLGYEQNEVLGQPFTVLLAPESHAAARDYLDGLKANGVASVLNDGRDVVGRERQGRAVPLFMTIGRVGQGANAKFCAVLRDVTHWKKAESELKDARAEAERTSAQKSDFLAKISHEIRTPLNAILGFTEVIVQERFGPVGNERYKDYLKDIHASGIHVMSLVNDLLDLSKIESGKLDLTFASVNANKIVQECVSIIQPQATKERVIVRVSLAPRLPNIVADERSLRQIVLNLLSNAVKFNEPGGQVIVSTALTDAGHAVIRVRDTGIGMNESDIERAMEPFRQLETSRMSQGTGLGLPLTKAMVEANRAALTIKSKRNEGTLIEVTFPPTRVLAE